MRQLTEIIIHCTATPSDWRDGDPTSAKVAEVKRWHTSPKPNGRGWTDIGYHFLIDRDGTVASGRPMERDGAHAIGHNEGTVAISLFGGQTSAATDQFEDNYTAHQEAALRGLIADLQKKYPTIKKISGHNQYANKACPGFDAPRWYARKAERTAVQSTTLQAVAASGSGVVGTGAVAVGALDGTAQIIVIGFLCVAALGLAWIARERIRKFVAGQR